MSKCKNRLNDINNSIEISHYIPRRNKISKRIFISPWNISKRLSRMRATRNAATPNNLLPATKNHTHIQRIHTDKQQKTQCTVWMIIIGDVCVNKLKERLIIWRLDKQPTNAIQTLRRARDDLRSLYDFVDRIVWPWSILCVQNKIIIQLNPKWNDLISFQIDYLIEITKCNIWCWTK